jgi:hypothetical protein
MECEFRDISPEQIEYLYQHYCEMDRQDALHLDMSELILSVRDRRGKTEGAEGQELVPPGTLHLVSIRRPAPDGVRLGLTPE